jgi:hypothetical protein
MFRMADALQVAQSRGMTGLLLRCRKLLMCLFQLLSQQCLLLLQLSWPSRR